MLDELADLFLGSRCPGCGRPGLGVCPACRTAVAGPATWVRDSPALAGLPVASAGRYAEPLDRLLTAHKDRGALTLTPLLASRLAAAIGLLLDSPVATGDDVPVLGHDGMARPRPGTWSGVVLVPIPSSPAAVRSRGFDHSHALARGAARKLGGQQSVPVRRALRRVAHVEDQAHLSRAQRRRNQSGSMRALSPPAPGKKAVVVDDICTTGASLAEGSRALRAAGWTVLGGAVVAHPTRAPGDPDARGLKSR